MRRFFVSLLLSLAMPVVAQAPMLQIDPNVLLRPDYSRQVRAQQMLVQVDAAVTRYAWGADHDARAERMARQLACFVAINVYQYTGRPILVAPDGALLNSEGKPLLPRGCSD